MARERSDRDIAAVRQRPGMYFGSTGPTGLEHLVLEVVSNSLDQFIAGHADQVAVSFHGDGSVTIADNGSGISVAKGESGVPLVEEMFTTVRTTPTADGHSPHVHLAFGVGLGAVSAVCQSIVVDTVADGVAYRQTFGRGRVTSPLLASRSPDGAVGTTIRLHPDPEIFGQPTWDTDALRSLLRTTAQLTPGLTLVVNGERFGPVDDLSELFARVRTPSWDLLHGDPFLIDHGDGLSSAAIALGWIEPPLGPTFRSFCNFREMSEGGTHLQGIEEGLRLVFGAAPVRDLMRGSSASSTSPCFGPMLAGRPGFVSTVLKRSGSSPTPSPQDYRPSSNTIRRSPRCFGKGCRCGRDLSRSMTSIRRCPVLPFADRLSDVYMCALKVKAVTRLI